MLHTMWICSGHIFSCIWCIIIAIYDKCLFFLLSENSIQSSFHASRNFDVVLIVPKFELFDLLHDSLLFFGTFFVYGEGLVDVIQFMRDLFLLQRGAYIGFGSLIQNWWGLIDKNAIVTDRYWRCVLFFPIWDYSLVLFEDLLELLLAQLLDKVLINQFEFLNLIISVCLDVRLCFASFVIE